jgi:hypothetical protein
VFNLWAKGAIKASGSRTDMSAASLTSLLGAQRAGKLNALVSYFHADNWHWIGLDPYGTPIEVAFEL